MGYEANNARATGKHTEAVAARYLNEAGYLAAKPQGRDSGIDLVIREQATGRIATAQVKGRGQAANPRWFQVSISPNQVEMAWNAGRLDQAWINKILQTDFWLLISIPLDEIWVIPSPVVLDIARANEAIYGSRLDNRYDSLQYDSRGGVAKKQKELNLDVVVHGKPLWSQLVPYRNTTDALRKWMATKT